jgi:hypothetical protein
MNDQNHRAAQVDAFVKKNKIGLIAGAVAALLLFANAGNGNTPQPGNGMPAVQGPRQAPQQGPLQGPQQGPGPMAQGDGSDVPFVQGGDVPGMVEGPVGVSPAAGDGGVDMDEWRRRQAQDDIEQRQRIDTIREEERCRNADGTEDTVSIHSGC